MNKSFMKNGKIVIIKEPKASDEYVTDRVELRYEDIQAERKNPQPSGVWSTLSAMRRGNGKTV